MADARSLHPDWTDQSAAVAQHRDRAPRAFATGNFRAALLAELGFVTPLPIVGATPEAGFFLDLSAGDQSPPRRSSDLDQ